MSEIVEQFRDVDGELRVLAALKSTSWEVEFIRDDLKDVYDESDLERAYRSVMANQVSSADFGSVGEFGDLIAQQYFFEDIIVFQFPSSRYEGVFVSYDRKDPFPVMEVIETAEGVPAIDG